MWFVYVRDRFWIGTSRDNVKTRNASTNPTVSLALEDGDRPVVVEGVVTVHLHNRPIDVVDFFRNYGWDITSTSDPDLGTIVRWRNWLFVVVGR